jgi:hypothetical protein
MSKQAAIEFLEAINTDAVLRDELSATAGDLAQVKPDNKEFAGEMAIFANAHGYSFDAADARDAYREMLEAQLASSGRELADQELEVVAGGAAEGGCCATSVKLAV